MDKDYFHDAMKIFHDDYPHVIFVIVTDDMAWARENLNFPGLQV